MCDCKLKRRVGTSQDWSLGEDSDLFPASVGLHCSICVQTVPKSRCISTTRCYQVGKPKIQIASPTKLTRSTIFQHPLAISSLSSTTESDLATRIDHPTCILNLKHPDHSPFTTQSPPSPPLHSSISPKKHRNGLSDRLFVASQTALACC